MADPVTENGESEQRATTNGDAAASPAGGGVRAKRPLPTKTLPSDRLAFEKQMAALRAYVVAHQTNGGRPVKNEDAASIIEMSKATIVVTNAFFSEVGLLIRQKEDQGFVPSPDAIAYYKAYEWDPAHAGTKLRPVFERAWFAEALIPRLKMRPHEEGEARTVLADACQAVKDYEDRVAMLVDYLALAGLIVRDGGFVKPAASNLVERIAAPLPAAPVQAAVPAAQAQAIVEEGHDRYTLVLDPKQKRKVVIEAPHTITSKELERIRAWLGVQLIIEDETT